VKALRVTLVFVSLVLISLIGATQSGWPNKELYFCISASGGYYDFQGKCTIAGETLTISTWDKSGKGPVGVFRRRLNSSQLQRLVDVINASRVLDALGQMVGPEPDPEVTVTLQAGHRCIRFQLTPDKPGSNPPQEVSFWDHTPKSVRTVIAELNRLVPTQYQFLKEP
jgi:hypothetical protein